MSDKKYYFEYSDPREDRKRAQKSERLRKRRKRRRIILVVEALVLVLLIGVLYVYSKFGMINYDTSVGEIMVNPLAEETEEILHGYKNIALFGVDNRTQGAYDKASNSDTIIVMSINNDTSEIRLLSVYRDTYLNVYGNSYQKCNAAYASGRDGAGSGPAAAIEMLNKNLDLDIKDYVAVDFKALVDAVDAVGGLEFEITSREANEMNKFIAESSRWVGKKSSQVSSGQHTLDGVQTLSFARIRHDSNDFRRAQRQREVVTKLIDKAKSSGIGQINALVDAIFPEVSTSLSLMDLLSLVTQVSKFQLGDTAGFPKHLTTKTLGNKGSCVIPCTLSTNVSYAHEFLFGEEEYIPTNTVNQISMKIVADTGMTEKNAVDYGFSDTDNGADAAAAAIEEANAALSEGD